MKESKQAKAKHTPGPWTVKDDSIIGPKGNVVAEVCGYSVLAKDPAQRAQGGREANARLIAAAPDLLAALTMLLDRLTYHGGVDPIREEGPIEDARNAIAKAEGE